jgi:hypothetical protein
MNNTTPYSDEITKKKHKRKPDLRKIHLFLLKEENK